MARIKRDRTAGASGASSDGGDVGVRLRTACTSEQIEARGDRKAINLALQGGGAHGAFTWGVLDRLLEDDRVAPDAISATSAGAMNAVVMAWGVSQGGREGGRAKLEEFWRAISDAGQLWSPMKSAPWEAWLPQDTRANQHSPVYAMFLAATHVFSPYQLNPFDFNPLRDVLESIIDFEYLQECPFATRLFLSATNVRTGKIRIFENHELSADVVLASACLPFLFKAVEIGGEAYWDGGYMGNPAIFPLIYKGASRDVVVVHVNPIVRAQIPTTAPEILDRINEITFNSSLMREMRAIAFVSRLLEDEHIDDSRYARMLIHAIRDDAEMSSHGAATKLSPDWTFLVGLKEAGRRAADQWLAQNFDALGLRSTVDLEGVYL